MTRDKSIAILGAGKLGITLAQRAVKAGYETYVAGSGAAEDIALTIKTLVPGARAVAAQAATSQADTVILALPLSKFRNLSPQRLAGKLVIDAMNYWWEVDGPRQDTVEPGLSSSVAVQAFLGHSRVVKSFSHMGYHNLHDEARLPDEPGRKALAIAGDDPQDVQTVAAIVDDFGFDPVIIGPLSHGAALEPGAAAFGANVNATELRKLIGMK